MHETEMNRAVRLQIEKAIREMVNADRIHALIEQMPKSGQKLDTIRIVAR